MGMVLFSAVVRLFGIVNFGWRWKRPLLSPVMLVLFITTLDSFRRYEQKGKCLEPRQNYVLPHFCLINLLSNE